MLRATPRLPEDDSTSIDPGRSNPSCSAASTMDAAAFSLIDPAKLKPSHLRNKARPSIDRRSTYRFSSLYCWGAVMTVTLGPSTAVSAAAAIASVADAVVLQMEFDRT